MKTETWAARSRYQKGIEARLRIQATPPSANATRLRSDQGAADDEVDRGHPISARKGRDSAC